MKYKSVLITGASSGIGAALAKEFASQGVSALFLCGRDEKRLFDVVEQCRAISKVENFIVEGSVLDVCDSQKVESWIRACDSKCALDIVFANAGVATGPELNMDNVRRTFNINVGGVVNAVLPTIDMFLERKREGHSIIGQIVITASIAGYHGLPQCPSYSATKSCVKAWGAGLRGMLHSKGILVNVVCPGFVRSAITDKNTCPMPFFMEADKAARIIIDRVSKNKAIIAFPWQLRFVTWLMACLPEVVSEKIFRGLPEKNSSSGAVK